MEVVNANANANAVIEGMMNKLSKGEIMKLLMDCVEQFEPVSKYVDKSVKEILSSRPVKPKSVTVNDIRKTLSRNQVISVQSIMRNCSRVIPTQVTSMGVKCKVMNTITEECNTIGEFSEEFADLNDILTLCLGEQESRTPEESALYSKYIDTVDYFLVYEITEHVRESVCATLKGVMQHCYMYNIDMYNIVDEPELPQLICILFMKMTTEEEFNVIFNESS